MTSAFSAVRECKKHVDPIKCMLACIGYTTHMYSMKTSSPRITSLNLDKESSVRASDTIQCIYDINLHHLISTLIV